MSFLRNVWYSAAGGSEVKAMGEFARKRAEAIRARRVIGRLIASNQSVGTK